MHALCAGDPDAGQAAFDAGRNSVAGEEVKSTLFRPSHEKFRTVVLKGVRNISDAL